MSEGIHRPDRLANVVDMTALPDDRVPRPDHTTRSPRPATSERERIAAWRKTLAPEAVAASSEQLARRCTDDAAFETVRGALESGLLATYWPLWGEIDPQPLAARILGPAQAVDRVVYPMIRNDRLAWYRWTESIPPSGKVRGTPDPGDNVDSVPIEDVELMLVPLVAFDAGGNRLGHGAGHYDRTLGPIERTSRPLLAGLAYDEQELDEWVPETWDVPLDLVLTPTRTMFAGS